MLVKYWRSRLGAKDAKHQIQLPTGQKAIKDPELSQLPGSADLYQASIYCHVLQVQYHACWLSQ